MRAARRGENDGRNGPQLREIEIDRGAGFGLEAVVLKGPVSLGIVSVAVLGDEREALGGAGVTIPLEKVEPIELALQGADVAGAVETEIHEEAGRPGIVLQRADFGDDFLDGAEGDTLLFKAVIGMEDAERLTAGLLIVGGMDAPEVVDDALENDFFHRSDGLGGLSQAEREEAVSVPILLRHEEGLAGEAVADGIEAGAGFAGGGAGSGGAESIFAIDGGAIGGAEFAIGGGLRIGRVSGWGFHE